ncbi:uncharacterized protein [Ptychodera flava]|uniref:uncharacterized protein n=1 Tax=Ptychodera flava TaxID=63121 RepID=UPI003969DC80
MQKSTIFVLSVVLFQFGHAAYYMKWPMVTVQSNPLPTTDGTGTLQVSLLVRILNDGSAAVPAGSGNLQLQFYLSDDDQFDNSDTNFNGQFNVDQYSDNTFDDEIPANGQQIIVHIHTYLPMPSGVDCPSLVNKWLCLEFTPGNGLTYQENNKCIPFDTVATVNCTVTGDVTTALPPNDDVTTETPGRDSALSVTASGLVALISTLIGFLVM